jgi:DNA-binding transcriptional LysR family regulator
MIVPIMEQLNPHLPVDPMDLLIFAQVAELGSFSRAASKLALPKSTVSRRIAALEAHLGEKLLVRTTRRQSLSELGEHLLEHARQVLLEVEAVGELRERRQAAPSGRLRVSMPNDIATLMLADSLAAFIAMFPGISLELDLSPRRVDLIGEGYDLAVRIGPLQVDSMLIARKLTEFSMGMYASASYLANHGEPELPDELAHHAGICLMTQNAEAPVWALRRGEQEWQGSAPGRTRVNSPELLIQLAVAGVGITAVPDYFATSWVKQGHLKRVLPAWCLPSIPVWAVFHERKLMPAKTRVFLQMLQTGLGSGSTVR